MKKKTLLASLTVVGIGFVLTVLPFMAAYGESAPKKPIELRLSHMFPIGAPVADHAQRWADKIAKDSEGRLTVRVYPSDTLVKAPQLWGAMIKGICDLGFSFMRAPEQAMLTRSICGFFPLTGERFDVNTIVKVWNDTYAKFPEVRAEWEENKILWFGYQDGWSIVSTKPIRSLEDMKGLQIRVSNKQAAETIRAWGGSPVFMRMGECATALEKGIVAAAYVPLDGLASFKLADLCSYTTYLYSYMPMLFAAMGKGSYNRLPSNFQKVIDDSIEWGTKDAAKSLAGMEDRGVAYAKTKGHEFITLSPQELPRWRDLLMPVQQKWAQELDAKGLPGTKTLEFVRERFEFYCK